jgi:hypothetical protein
MRSAVEPAVIRLLPRPNFRYTNLMHLYQPEASDIISVTRLRQRKS